MTTAVAETGERIRIGATIREMRQMRGLSPDELAREVGISRSYLANIEAGRKRLPPVLASKVAAALKVPQISLVADVA